MSEAGRMQASGCPMHGIGAGFNPYYSDDMFPILAAARASEPVFYSPEVNCWVVTRYEDAMAILHDPERFSSENTSEPVTPMHADAVKILQEGGFAAEAVQSNAGGEKHARIRNVSTQLLNVRTFARLEPDIRQLVAEGIARIADKGSVDIVSGFTYELPARVIFRILGVPEEDTADIKRWSNNRTQIQFSPSTYEQQIEGARNLVEFWNYCVRFVQDRLRNPREDFPSNLLKLRNGDDSIITINEVNSVMFGLFFAGHETTTNQLTNAFRSLLSTPGAWEALCADPSLIPNAVEEAFRYSGAVINWRRRTKCEVEVGGIKLPAGSNVMLSFASANRDATLFSDPENFDVRRPNARKQITMGNGLHVCLGAPLARLEMKIVLEEFTRRFPRMRLADAPINHVKSLIFRAPHVMYVDLN